LVPMVTCAALVCALEPNVECLHLAAQAFTVCMMACIVEIKSNAHLPILDGK